MAQFAMNLHRGADDRIGLRVTTHFPMHRLRHDHQERAKYKSAEICAICGQSFFQNHVAADNAFQVPVLGAKEQGSVLVQ